MKTGAFFQLIRSGNLLIMLLTQVLAYYAFTDFLLPEDLWNNRLILLVLSTLLTAAAGYIINDYLDVKMDMINKPESVIIGNHISRRWAMLLRFSFNALGILLAGLINYKVGLAVTFCVVVLWFYSTHFKKTYLTGNVLVAFMSAFVLLIIKYVQPQASSLLILSYSLFAFVLSLIREIVKDAEDLEGDMRFKCKTLPIVSGMLVTRKLLMTLTTSLIVLVVVFLGIGLVHIPFAHRSMTFVYAVYMVFAVEIPLLYILFRIRKADVKQDFTQLSFLCKLAMLTGLLSMILIKL